MITVVLDVEMTGRLPGSMFALAMCAQHSDGKRTTLYATFPEVSKQYRSNGAMAFWTEDGNRKEFLDRVLAGKGDSYRATRSSVAMGVRKFVDRLYETDDEVVFYSDFPVFDYGAVNSLLVQYMLLPLYLKDDGAPPAECVNHYTFARGLARVAPNTDSDAAFKMLGLSKASKSDNHDPIVDVNAIMDDVQAILLVL